MKTWIRANEFHQLIFNAAVGKGETVQSLPYLQASLVPFEFSGPRRAVASALPHLLSANGKLTLSDKVSAQTANAIQDISGRNNFVVDTDSIVFDATDMPEGNSTVNFGEFDSLSDASKFIDGFADLKASETCVTAVKDNGLRGFLVGTRFRIIASNLWLSRLVDQPEAYFLKSVALSILYSGEFSAGRIRIHGSYEIDDSFFEKVAFCLFTVGLSLERPV